MSKRTFYDMYHEAWDIVDKNHRGIPFWKRMRLKQLLNQMLRKYKYKGGGDESMETKPDCPWLLFGGKKCPHMDTDDKCSDCEEQKRRLGYERTSDATSVKAD